MNFILEAIKALFRKVELMRPCYDDRKYEKAEFTFDGNFDNYETIYDEANNTCFIKVSDDITDVNQLAKSTWKEMYYGKEKEHFPDDFAVDDDGDCILVQQNRIIVAKKDSPDLRDGFDGSTASLSKGIWFVCRYSKYGSINYVPTYLSCNVITAGELKRLDEKYLPDEVTGRLEEMKEITSFIRDSIQDSAEKKFRISSINGSGYVLDRGFHNLANALQNGQDVSIEIYKEDYGSEGRSIVYYTIEYVEYDVETSRIIIYAMEGNFENVIIVKKFTISSDSAISVTHTGAIQLN